MKATLKEKTTNILPDNGNQSIDSAIAKSWSKIAPFWPLKNLIAVNPVAGFEDLRFEEGLTQANAYFQQKGMPMGMQLVNRESIKWLQVFFDQGQSTIRMPLRHEGLLKSTLSLIRFDKQIHKNDKQKIKWLESLPKEPEALIADTLYFLGINTPAQEQFLTLLLTTLPGWAAYIQYRTNWADTQDSANRHTVTQTDYLAFRLFLTCLIWPKAKELLSWHKKVLENADTASTYRKVLSSETSYQKDLLKKLMPIPPPQLKLRPEAQLVFCIDVRSEPFRRALESQGNYETYGFAGFFGIPVSIENAITGESYASCPVLLRPAHTVQEQPEFSYRSNKDGYNRLQGIKKIYQSLKYNFTTPFSLVEIIGLASGIWMAVRSLSPKGASYIQSALKKSIAHDYSVTPDIGSIPFGQQVAYGAGALKMMGLTENFAPLVVFCGHGSVTENNAHATALDCGACGGRQGASNARILAKILNKEEVRAELRKQYIEIPEDTIFLAAKHNTTTDEVEIYNGNSSDASTPQLLTLQKDLVLARNKNCLWRGTEMGIDTRSKRTQQNIFVRSKDWAEVRPEWGLAKNASFIVGPRWLTKDTNLEGRTFLHSYEWEKDSNGSYLTTILTAPMVVAQWINAQYFFSTLDNIAYGSGSKITMNITGKIGIMQGNASDLMHGLPFQSVFKSDNEAYHKAMRLTVVVYAPRTRIDQVIQQHEILKKLFGNAWLYMICFDPQNDLKYFLKPDLKWENFDQTA